MYVVLYVMIMLAGPRRKAHAVVGGLVYASIVYRQGQC